MFVVLVGCGGSAVAAPTAAGNTPSKSAQMICAPEAQKEIAQEALGEQPTQPIVPTWVDHLYSCRYTYGAASFVVSVKELSSAAATTAYFDSLHQRLVGSTGLGLGQGGFAAPNGSVVIRKDFKVLYVDVSAIPAQFGNPLIDRVAVSTRVAILVLGCWKGN